MSSTCRLCPRNCNVDRSRQKGFCGAGDQITLARAEVHLWEEPPVSGSRGSGAIFFSNCTLKCPFCQNVEISHNGFGKEVSTERLAQIMTELAEKGVHTISLVTPTQYADKVIEAVALAREQGLSLPVVYNCGGYETQQTVGMLRGTVDVFLPDFKFFDERCALRYLGAGDYPAVATNAIKAMLETVGEPVFNDEGILQHGVIVRHLLMPGLLFDSMRCVEHLYETFGDRILISLMSQYTPMPQCAGDRFLSRRVNPRHYDALVEFALSLGIERCYVQSCSSADERFIPPFDLTGV